MKHFAWIVLLLACLGCGRDVTTGKPAIPFKAESATGVHYSLLDLLHDGPVLVVFLPKSCPANTEVVTYLSLFERAYRGKITILGLYQGDTLETRAWQEQAKAPFPICADWDHLIAEKYGYDRGPIAALVSKATELVAEYRKFSPDDWKGMNEAIAGLVGTPVAKIDLSVAGKTPMAFCDIPIRARR